MKYERPTDLESAQASLESTDAAPLGGGTDLLVTMREGLTRPSTLVDLTAIPGSDTIEWLPDESLRLGAAVRIAMIAEDAGIRDRFPALGESCDAVGSPALRNMGTLGGNLCQRPRCWYFRSSVPCLKSGGNDCPAAAGENQHHAIFGGGPCFAVHPSDPAVALTALEATIEVKGPAGTRLVPIGEFFVLPEPDPQRENVLAAGEFVTAVIVPAHSSGGRQRYAKVLQRGAWDFALASIAAVRRGDGTVRMVLGGVAHIPWRVNPSVEEDVASAPLGPEDIDVLAERAMYDARPLAKNGYKVTLATNLIRESIAFLNA